MMLAGHRQGESVRSGSSPVGWIEDNCVEETAGTNAGKLAVWGWMERRCVAQQDTQHIFSRLSLPVRLGL